MGHYVDILPIVRRFLIVVDTEKKKSLYKNPHFKKLLWELEVMVNLEPSALQTGANIRKEWIHVFLIGNGKGSSANKLHFKQDLLCK